MPDQFPFRQRLSLRPLIEFWESMAPSTDEAGASFISVFLAEVRQHPTLGANDLNPKDLDQESPLVNKLMSAVFPWAAMGQQIGAAMLPFQLSPFYSTEAFRKLEILDYFSPELNPECPMSPDDMTVARTMKAYHFILERLYRTPSDFSLPFVVGRRHPDTGLERFFQIEFDTRFVEVKVRGQKPRLSAQEIADLLEDPLNLSRWMELLPAARFEFEGFGLLGATDVTNQQLLSLLKDDLLDHRDFTADKGLELLQGHLGSLLEIQNLDVGIMALNDGDICDLDHTEVVGRSMLLSDDRVPDCSMRKASAYARALETGQPVFVPDLEAADGMTGLEYHVSQLGYRSLGVFPLLQGDRAVGLLELASKEVNGVGPRQARRLGEVTPLLATALTRIMDERENRIQSLIKRRFTAIHPVVEWRFREAAMRQMAGTEADSDEQISFADVYPLYGLSDTRSSSTFRADAIRLDLEEQLGLAFAVVIEAASIAPQPALDELGFRLTRQIEELQGMLSAGEESEPLLLLQRSVEPLFPKLADLSPRVAQRIEEYKAAINPELGMVYHKRRDFEESITQINDTLSRFLEARQETAQSLAPHYFEKYRTDGVDYNIYAGASLRKDAKFDQLDLRNLRLWQLMTMAGCAWEMEALKKDLALPLEVTHLILVQSQPLAIQFRADEKRFDVDGAYNIRYEIVKKRIDKALVRGTGERLTQPGKIAIVYSLATEQREYSRYIEYLQQAGYLDSEVEMLDLEPLQGVQGLRALRVTVAERQPESDFLIGVLPDSVRLADRS
ncbi:MAG: GAF domain-containing protein [Rhodothermales bacterium]|jgi:GAF domain-containing protein